MYWTGPLGTRILAIVVSGLGRTCDLATLVTCVPILCAETQKAGPLLHQKLVDKGLFPSSWSAQLGLRQPCRSEAADSENWNHGFGFYVFSAQLGGPNLGP